MNPKSSLQFLAFTLFFWVAVLSVTEGNAQTRPASTDSIKVAPAADSVRGDLETTINYKAKDSILYDAVNQIMYLYGTAHIDYGEISLDADFIQINWKTNIINAQGMRDTAGVLQGKPLFKSGAETYQAETMAYNFKTKKGRVLGAVTTQGEGFIHAETIKKNDQNEIFGQHARYTTCNLEHPHFYIKATKMKVIPGDRVVAGPFHLVFADVPTPIGFPFGFFPSPQKRGSGILIPTFGESTQQGFYLRDGGFYWAVNEFMDMRITGDIFSLGGYGVRAQSNYTKRYKYRGNFSLSHTYNKGADNFTRGASVNDYYVYPTDSRDIWVTWSHSPVSRPGEGQFSASVNAGSQFYNQRNSMDPRQALSANFNSSISYGKSNPNSPFNYRVSISQNQRPGTNTYTYVDAEKKTQTISEQAQAMSFTLPDFSFGVASQSPIEWFGGTMTGRWIEGIRIGYNLNLQQFLTNQVSRGNSLGFPFSSGVSRGDTILAINGRNLSQIYKNANLTINHDIPITLGTINLLKYFKLTPSISYRESWATKKFNYSTIPNSNLIRIDTVSGLHRVYQYSGNLSLTTNLYGIAQINTKKIQAIRHTVTPNISYGYTPDFGRPEVGYYQRVQVDSLGNSRLVSRFPTGVALPGSGLSSGISFGVDNNVEMKVKTDSVGIYRKVSLIDRFAIRSAYNFAADSFKLANISVDLSTRLFNTLSVTTGATFDPYVYVNGVRRNRLLVEEGGFRFARPLNTFLNFSFEANPTAREQQNKSGAPIPTTTPALQREITAADYVAFNIPWTLSVGFTSNFSRDFLADKLVNQATSLDLNGSVTLTDKWAFTYSTGYDFKNKLLSYTNLAITRDLHCWQMSIDWVPFGAFQRYSINIAAKSSLLRDLRIRRSDSSMGRAW